ncbi:hypothetical protein GJ496_002938 [Pomphorhynchus laevis]|nr:hypothetical protein GJ496_002938 [Pomphorhynchus laevis]
MLPTAEVCSFQQIRAVITCRVCQNPYNDPRILLCGHSFCRTCIEQLSGSGDCNFVQCPDCGKSSEFSNINMLVHNTQLAELAKVNKIDIRSNSLCSACNQNPSITKCEHCNQLCCTGCINLHQDQISEELNTITEKLSDQIVMVRKDIKNKRHQFEVCKDQAKVDSLAKLELTKKQLESTWQRMYDTLQQFTESKEKEASQAIVNVNKELEQIEILVKHVKELLTGQISSVSVGQLLQIRQSLLEPGKRLPSLSSQIGIDFPTLKFIASKHEIKEDLLGQYSIERSSKNSLRLLEIVGREGSHKGEFRYPCSLSIDWHGYLIVCDRDNSRVQILGIEDDKPHIRQVVGLNKPCDVCCDLSAQHFIITDEHRVSVLDDAFRTVHILGSTEPGKSINSFNMPWGVCSDSESVYVADNKNDRIVVLRLMTYEWLRDIPLNVGASPNYICTHDDRLIYSSIENKKVTVLSKHGQILFQFPKAKSLLRVLTPMNVRIHDNFIFVVDSVEHAFLAYTMNGEFFQKYQHEYFARLSGLSFYGSVAYLSDIATNCIFKIIGPFCQR